MIRPLTAGDDNGLITGPKGSGQYWLGEGAPGASSGPAGDGLQCRRTDHRTRGPEQPVESERRSAVNSCVRDDRNSAQRESNAQADRDAQAASHIHAGVDQ